MEGNNLIFKLFTVIFFFLFDIKPFVHDIILTIQLAVCSLQKRFVWFSGNFVCFLHQLTAPQVLEPLNCHMPTWFIKQWNNMHVPNLCSILYKTTHTGQILKTTNHYHASLDCDLSRFITLQRTRSNYFHE